jgi:hypothetical protein
MSDLLRGFRHEAVVVNFEETGLVRDVVDAADQTSPI